MSANTLRAWLIVGLFLSTIHYESIAQERDNSKPTNLYSQIDNFLEYTQIPEFYTLGYNMRLSIAPSEELSLVAEVPFRYHAGTEKAGFGDIRLRTFWVPYKNYERTVGSFGASLDVILPAGDFDKGLGTSSWRFSPGLILGLILNKSQTISIFPNLSYTYTTEPTNENVPDFLKEADHGLTFQVISSFMLAKSAFVLITPIYNIKDFGDINEDEFIIEVEPVIDVAGGKYQAGVFYRGAFQSNQHTFSVYFTIFL